jgi:hypothetical protein
MRQRYMAGTAPAPFANQKITAAARDQLAGRSTAPDFVVRGRQAWNETQHRYQLPPSGLRQAAIQLTASLPTRCGNLWGQGERLQFMSDR